MFRPISFMFCLTVTVILTLSLWGCSSSDPSPEKSSSPVNSKTSSTGNRNGGTVPGGSGGVTGGGASGGSSSSSSGGATASSTGEAASGTGGATTQKPTAVPLSPSEYRKKAWKQRPFSDFSDMPGYDEVRRAYQPGSSFASVKRGEEVYRNHCIFCHDERGQVVRNIPALSRANVAHLANRGEYRYGSTAKSVYRTVAHGTLNPAKGRFAEALTEEEIWDVAYFVVSLQKDRI